MQNEPPPESVPLRAAASKWCPRELAELEACRQRLDRDGRQNYSGPPNAPVYHYDDGHSATAQLMADVLKAGAACSGSLERLLLSGKLLAWGRPASPLADIRSIPADAWASLRIQHAAEGRAGGGGALLFGLRVSEPAPVQPAQPDEPPLVPKPSAEVVSRAATGIARDLLAKHGRKPTHAEAVALMLEAGFQLTESKAAVARLPPELKRGRGEHDRTLAAAAGRKTKETATKKPLA